MNELVTINLWKATALLLAERRRQVREYLKEHPNDYKYTEEYKELCFKIAELKRKYISWRNKQNITHDITNTVMNSECRQ